MNLHIINEIKIVFLLLVVISFSFAGQSNAAIRIKKTAPLAGSLNDSVSNNSPATANMLPRRHHFSLIPRRVREQMETLRDRQSRHGSGNNSYGILSLCSVVVSLAAAGELAALGITASVALATVLVVVGGLAVIASVVFGAMGIGHDGRRGMAIAGMTLGIVELSIAAFIGLAFLLLMAAF